MLFLESIDFHLHATSNSRSPSWSTNERQRTLFLLSRESYLLLDLQPSQPRELTLFKATSNCFSAQRLLSFLAFSVVERQ